MKIQSPQPSYDLVVIGGGMVGASFACGIARTFKGKLSILVVEAVEQGATGSQPSFDDRSTALSFGSRLLFESMGVWSKLKCRATSIRQIHVSDRGRFGSTRINHSEQHVEALGYVVENRELGQVLDEELDGLESVHVLCPATIASIAPSATGMNLEIHQGSSSDIVAAGLVILADGGRSSICSQLGIERRVEEYGQYALIANLSFEKSHDNVAFERFTDTGPLALLPLESFEGRNRGALVWSVGADQRDELLHLDERELLARLQDRFGDRLGRFTQIGTRACYPLTLALAREQVRPGLVLLGNVAHTLHPVAGQGFNLALRDSAALIVALSEGIANGFAVGDMAILQDYLERQEFDQTKSIAFTDYLTWLFSSNSQSRVWIRKVGLLSLELAPALKKEFAEQAMGLK